MSSGKTLNERYWKYEPGNVGVAYIRDVFTETEGWFVFTHHRAHRYNDWRTAIKVAYGERTP